MLKVKLNFDIPESLILEEIENVKEEMKDPNKVVSLDLRFKSEYKGTSELEVIESIEEVIYKFRIKEKACYKLMLEGAIYPVSNNTSNNVYSIAYNVKREGPTRMFCTSLKVPRLAFDEFIKM